MLRDGTIEGLVRRLRRDYPALAAEAAGAVAQGIGGLVVRPTSPDNPRSYLAASAYNEMKRLLRHRSLAPHRNVPEDRGESRDVGCISSQIGSRSIASSRVATAASSRGCRARSRSALGRAWSLHRARGRRPRLRSSRPRAAARTRRGVRTRSGEGRSSPIRRRPRRAPVQVREPGPATTERPASWSAVRLVASRTRALSVPTPRRSVVARATRRQSRRRPRPTWQCVGVIVCQSAVQSSKPEALNAECSGQDDRSR